jgi:hypothetical protein
MKWNNGFGWNGHWWPIEVQKVSTTDVITPLASPSIDNHEYQTYMNYVQSQFMYVTTPSFSMKFETEWNDVIDAALKLQPQPAARSVAKEEPIMIRTCPYVCCDPTLPTNDLIPVGKENEINQN